MNTLHNSFAQVKQNRVSKKRNVIGLYNSGRSISLNQLSTEYVDQFYKEQYLIIKEQHEQTKKQLIKQQEQLKQLNYRLQRLLQEKKDFLSQFVHYSQVNSGYLVQELEMTNLRLEKENKKLKDQLLLAQVRAASYNKNQLGKVMIINMKQHLQTNYGWVKARIDSGLNDKTKRNPINGQLIRQQKMISKYSTNRSTTSTNKSKQNNRTILNNKMRHRRVSFSNQLEQEHLYEDDFEQDNEQDEDDEQIMEDEDWTLESSDDEENKNKLNKDNENLEIEKRLDNKINKMESSAEESSDEENFKQVKLQLDKSKNKIKKLEEIVYLQQQFIDKQQELVNQNDYLDSLRQDKENWFNKENKAIKTEKLNEGKHFEKEISTNLSSNISLSLDSSLDEIESIQTAGGNELQIINQVSNNQISKDLLNKISDNIEIENEFNHKNEQLNNYDDKKFKNLGENEKIYESTTNSSILDDLSLSSVDQFALVKGKNNLTISNSDHEQIENNFKINNKTTIDLLDNLSKQLQNEKVKNEQLKINNKERLRELEHNINQLSKENEILRNSLEKCIQDCLNEIGSGL